MGHRMSSLPLARFCPMAPELDKQHGESGRSAVVSTAFHALCSDPDSPETHRKIARLTPEERDELEALHVPTPLHIADMVLGYSRARAEVTLALALSDGTKSIGHADMVWIVFDGEGTCWVVVGDIKRSRWTTPDGANSLQLRGYLAAAVEMAKKLGYEPEFGATAIWQATEGRWDVGDAIDLSDELAWMELCDEIDAAATNKGEASTGAHCKSCYSRVHCPAYLLPGAIGEHNPDLAPLSTGKATHDEVLRALYAVEAMKTVASQAETLVKAWVDVNGPLRDGDAVYRCGEVKGRSSFNGSKFKKDHPELAAKYTTTGKPTTRYAWGKAGK